MLVALLLASPALATDQDSDGWATNASPPDCNDNDQDINPSEAEVLHDGVDNDCDGSPIVRRQYFSPFESGASNDWNLNHGTISDGRLHLAPPPKRSRGCDVRATVHVGDRGVLDHG